LPDRRTIRRSFPARSSGSSSLSVDSPISASTIAIIKPDHDLRLGPAGCSKVMDQRHFEHAYR
jgi:hypothetical protein